MQNQKGNEQQKSATDLKKALQKRALHILMSAVIVGIVALVFFPAHHVSFVILLLALIPGLSLFVYQIFGISRNWYYDLSAFLVGINIGFLLPATFQIPETVMGGIFLVLLFSLFIVPGGYALIYEALLRWSVKDKTL